uniref:Uncharacterized protein n=1 Tax=Anguilla anguilla TaxID=7936 RepID=A0A0E9VY24_ANGAN
MTSPDDLSEAETKSIFWHFW